MLSAVVDQFLCCGGAHALVVWHKIVTRLIRVFLFVCLFIFLGTGGSGAGSRQSGGGGGGGGPERNEGAHHDVGKAYTRSGTARC
jgi:hypothetical protein